MAKKKKPAAKPEFYKADLLKSERYKRQRDVLSVILDDQKSYSLEQIDKMILNFLNKEVK